MPQKKYEQIRDQLLREIRSGHLSTGSRLKGEVQLAKDYGVSVLTVRRAMADLASSGYIIRRKKIGTFVVHPSTGDLEAFCQQRGIVILHREVALPQTILLTDGLEEATGVLILFSSSHAQIFSDSDGTSYAISTPNMPKQ